MASMLKPVILGYKTTGDSSADQYKCVKLSGDDKHIARSSAAAASSDVFGVQMSIPKNVAEQDVEVAVKDGAKVICGPAGVALGVSVTSDANGLLVAATTGQWAIGVTMDSGVSLDIVPIIIDRHVAL